MAERARGCRTGPATRCGERPSGQHKYRTHVKGMVVSSEFFRASVGALDEATEARFGRWALENCLRHLLVRENDGCLTLFAKRNVPRTLKSTKVCLRTVFSNFGQPLACVDPSWLVLLTRAEFEEATSAYAKAEEQPQCSEPRLEVAAGPAETTVLLSLSPGFDERAAALAALRIVPCVA